MKTTVLFALVVALLAHPPLVRGPAQEGKAGAKPEEQPARQAPPAAGPPKAAQPAGSGEASPKDIPDTRRRISARKD